jgi:hypothetical protein
MTMHSDHHIHEIPHEARNMVLVTFAALFIVVVFAWWVLGS